jgi:hypothetical protein
MLYLQPLQTRIVATHAKTYHSNRIVWHLFVQ